ncbi:cellulose biosynthesis protein BcsD [Serratia sp. L9]|uniref:cellulose biosynthesis protein BcsD n=1 Tax=Serratia sp. L9 TaxID=3423946 RepID=UPI003D670F14
MQDINNASYELDYYRQRQFKPGWQDLIEVVFSGIQASADDADSRDFLRLMGGNLARKLPLSQAETLGDLEDSLNAMLRHFDWGWVQIEASGEQMLLSHYAYPHSADPDSEAAWALSFASVLEGLYDAWLLAQGGVSCFSALAWPGQGQCVGVLLSQ